MYAIPARWTPPPPKTQSLHAHLHLLLMHSTSTAQLMHISSHRDETIKTIRTMKAAVERNPSRHSSHRKPTWRALIETSRRGLAPAMSSVLRLRSNVRVCAGGSSEGFAHLGIGRDGFSTGLTTPTRETGPIAACEDRHGDIVACEGSKSRSSGRWWSELAGSVRGYVWSTSGGGGTIIGSKSRRTHLSPTPGMVRCVSTVDVR